LTWPLLVFDRPLYVVAAFFAIWSVMIALLFVFSRAPEREVDARGSDMPESGELDARSD
jgi:hypothetical protein